MLHGSQSTRKYTTPKRSYVLKSTSFLGLAVSAVGLDLSSSVHAVLVIISGRHNQPHFTLLPPMQQHRPPPLPLPTTILLGTGAVVLGLGLPKIKEKTGLVAWGRRQAQPGDGVESGWCLQIIEIREKTDFRGGKNK